MHLFVLFLHPLLRRLEQICGEDLIVAYADDISTVVSNIQKLNEMRVTFRCFEKVAGARLNESKTMAIDIGITDNNSLTVPWVRTENEIKILGIIFANSVHLMVSLNWDKLVTNFSRLIWLHSLRTLSLHQKVTLLNTFLSSKMWYMAANLHLTTAHVAKLTARMRSFLFRGICATIPMQQLARNKEDGGLKLHLPAMKCKALLINRHLHEIETLPYYSSLLNQANPHPVNSIRDLPCLKIILSNVQNLPFQIRQHPSADLIHRYFVQSTAKPKVEIDNSAINWHRVWRNIASRKLLSSQRSILYFWVNKKTPHRKLLNIMRRADGQNCTHCDDPEETIQHKFFGCRRVRNAFELLLQEVSAVTGRRRPFQYEELMRPSLERLSVNTRTAVLKLLCVYISFIGNCNNRIDVDALKFNFEVEV